MKYTQKSFSVPVGSSKVTQEQWDAIFNPKLNKVKASRKKTKS